jgi:Tfp pilus assembly protein FimT
MIATAILGILGAVAAPNLKKWSRGYYLKSASTNLYSHMQMAKVGAIKDNQPWTIRFNPGTLVGYQVRNGAGQVVRTVSLPTDYRNAIGYGNPQSSSTLFDNATLTFNPNGLSTTGFAYLTAQDSTSYYRVGMPLANGIVKVQIWTNGQWK